MRVLWFVSVVLLTAGMALGEPRADDPAKPSGASKAAGWTPEPGSPPAPIKYTPPVMRSSQKDDTTIVVLPGSAEPALEAAAAPARTAAAVRPPPPVLPQPDPERPVLRRSAPLYPSEFGKESAIFCQHLIGIWTVDDAFALFGEPKSRRPSMGDEGSENGAIYAFSDPSSRYREIELDFDKESGALRTVFAYPWKMTWQECRKLWGNKVSAADAEKGRSFYSYLDRRMDVLVDSAGNVISFGLY